MAEQNLDRDYEYFLQNMEEWFTIYGHKFLAVKNRQILGVYDTFDEALETTRKTESVGSFLIQECFASKEECVYHFQDNVIFSPA